MAPKKRRTDNASKCSVLQRRDLEISHLSIAARAYCIWLHQGRPVGQDMANWLEAESELNRAAVLGNEVAYKALSVDLERSDITHRGLTSTIS